MYKPINKFKFSKPLYKVGDKVAYDNRDYTITAIVPEQGGWWYELNDIKYFVHESEIKPL
jgi:hypothetical protein